SAQNRQKIFQLHDRQKVIKNNFKYACTIFSTKIYKAIIHMIRNLNVKKLTVFVATIFTLTLTTSSVTPNASSEPPIPLKPNAIGQPVRTIVLDPGHGGKDAGARGSRANEKD